MSPARSPHSRFALVIWLGVLSAVGGLRFYTRAWQSGSFQADTVAWVWLAGSVIVGAAAVTALIKALRR